MTHSAPSLAECTCRGRTCPSCAHGRWRAWGRGRERWWRLTTRMDRHPKWQRWRAEATTHIHVQWPGQCGPGESPQETERVLIVPVVDMWATSRLIHCPCTHSDSTVWLPDALSLSSLGHPSSETHRCEQMLSASFHWVLSPVCWSVSMCSLAAPGLLLYWIKRSWAACINHWVAAPFLLLHHTFASASLGCSIVFETFHDCVNGCRTN